MSRAIERMLLACIAAYRLVVAPWLPSRCRFVPSCSAYAAEAIRIHGPWAGTRLAVARIGRCHPWHAGGHDPVPEAEARRSGTPCCAHGHEPSHAGR